MALVHERLREVGIRLAISDERDDVRTECTRLARVLQNRRCRVVGLVPAADDVAVPMVALQLGLALAGVTGSPIGVIDAHGSWPGSRALGDTSSGASLFSPSWLVDNLALLTPRSFDTGGTLPKLAAALKDEASVFSYLVIDLTGFDHIGEHLAAMEMLDAVAILARSGRTRASQLQRWMRDVPADRNLGVLLIGG